MFRTDHAGVPRDEQLAKCPGSPQDIPRCGGSIAGLQTTLPALFTSRSGLAPNSRACATPLDPPMLALAMVDTLQHVVVTGGGGTLARAIATELSAAGCVVESPGRDMLDVADPCSVRSYFADRKPDLVVCAAGLTRDQPIARQSPSDWDEVWSANFRGSQACARACLPGMLARGSGHILLVSSQSAHHPPPGQIAYATSKSALLGLTRDLAMAHGSQGIRVNAILPGFLDTRMTASVGPERRAEVLAEHALGRLNTCDAVARFVRFLHLELPHTSGQVFQLDSRPSGS